MHDMLKKNIGGSVFNITNLIINESAQELSIAIQSTDDSGLRLTALRSVMATVTGSSI